MKKLFETSEVTENNRYTKKVSVPQYLPNNIKPNIVSLCNTEKYSKLIKHINDSNISDEEKSFLKFAASRHIVFNYSLIADYYANSDKEMQELMEESALVILDFNDAIANGYIKLSSQLDKLLDYNDATRRKN